MIIKSFDAVIFDLWNTLIPLPETIKERAFRETASVLGTNPSLLIGPWVETRAHRETRDLLEYFFWLRGILGADWSDEDIKEAMRVRKSIHGMAFQTIDEDTVKVLRALRARGLKTAVVSNCSSDVRELLSASVLGTLLDVVVLSSEIGIMKPDLRIYTYAASLLGVACNRCVYVGDGYDNELEGAAAVGMHPLLLASGSKQRWSGPHVTTLWAVLEEVGVR